jgi:ubiquinone/menaquinone biosynthesis C-methylase UbiE
MGRGRRAIALDDPAGWVFNRMVEAYGARPPYPAALVDAVASRVGEGGRRVADIGAGIGHLALPLAARGLSVTAIEPASGMLARLREAAHERSLPIESVHASAEALPLEDASVDLVVVADAMHFFDAERAGLEVGRVLAPGGALVVVTCELGRSPFMREVRRAMEEAAPRRPRSVDGAMRQVAALARVEVEAESTFHDEASVDAPELERILRSISFVGPAMSPERFANFSARLHALEGPAIWARDFTLRCHRRAPRTRG